jgi:hypothetical protein
MDPEKSASIWIGVLPQHSNVAFSVDPTCNIYSPGGRGPSEKLQAKDDLEVRDETCMQPFRKEASHSDERSTDSHGRCGALQARCTQDVCSSGAPDDAPEGTNRPVLAKNLSSSMLPPPQGPNCPQFPCFIPSITASAASNACPGSSDSEASRSWQCGTEQDKDATRKGKKNLDSTSPWSNDDEDIVLTGHPLASPPLSWRMQSMRRPTSSHASQDKEWASNLHADVAMFGGAARQRPKTCEC